MIIRHALLVASLLVSWPVQAADKVTVVTSIPELAYAAGEIGGALVEAKSLLCGTENPHFVDAVPEFTRLIAEAQVVCIAGMELEVGYMPPVLTRAGNAQVQPGGKGYCETGRSVKALQVPTGPIDRSMGDVHPAGNPHFWLSPLALADGAKEIEAALERVDPAHVASYKQGLGAFRKKMETLSANVASHLAPVLAAQKRAGKPVLIEYHKEFVYFLEQFGLKSLGSIEEKPGVPPSAGRLAEVATAAKGDGVKVALAAEYNPAGTLDRFHELSHLPVVIVPTMIQADGKYKTYEELQLHMADALAKAVQ